MNRIRTAAFSALCCVLLLSAGCADSSSLQTSEESSGVQSDTTAVSETAASLTTTSNTTTGTTVQSLSALTESAPLLQEFEGMDLTGSVVFSYSLGGGKVAVLCTVFTNDSEGLFCHIIDVLNQKETKSWELETSSESGVGVTQDGRLITYMYPGTLKYYDLNTGNCKTVEYENDPNNILFDSTENMVYGFYDDGVYQCLENGSVNKVFEPKRVTGTFWSPASNDGSSILMLSEPSNSLTGMSFNGYECSTGSLLFSFDKTLYDASICGNYLISCDDIYDDETFTNRCNCSVYHKDSGKLIHCYQISENRPRLFTSSYSNYALQTVYGFESGDYESFYLCNIPAGTYKELELSCKQVYNVSARFLPECRLWFAAVTTNENDSDRSRLMLINPFAEPLTEQYPDAVIPEDEQLETKPLGREYAENRKIADRLEKDFGVRILIGNEVLGVPLTDYRIISTEDTTYQDGNNTGLNDQRMLTKALKFMRKELAKYPQGFFDKYRSSSGIGGLRFLITLDLPASDSSRSFSAGGLHFQNGVWSDIALNLFMLDYEDCSIHHEIWHSVEELMYDNGYPVNPSEWEMLNPPHFIYDSVDTYGTDDSKWDYVLNFSDNPYFARIYGTSNQKEDRATLVELIVDDFEDWEKDAEPYCNYSSRYEYLMTFPHLKAKILCLENMLQQYFGYVYWKEFPGVTG